MRARAAYIRSLGTTGILVLAAVLMLGTVGALVGFHRWPDGAAGKPVPSMPVTKAPEHMLTAVRKTHAPLVRRRSHRTGAGATSATAGLVKVVPVSSPRPVGSPIVLDPGEVAPTSPPAAAPAHNPAAPAPPSAPDPPQPPSTQAVQELVDQLLGPNPPAAVELTQPGQPLAVGVSVLGAHVTVAPPLPSR